jgi:hypothetical protein
MKRMTIRCGILSLALTLFFAATPASDAKATKQIRGTFTGQSIVIPAGEPGDLVFRQENVATGSVTHLGRVTAEWVLREVRFLSYSQLMVAQPDWIGTITAQNGDQIFGTYTFRSPVLPITLTGEVQFVAELRITGGTGRFEGATGRGVSVGRGNIWTRQFSLDLNGVITTN